MDNLDLVDLGQAHVDVQDVGALLLLADALAHHVVQIAVAQGLLQALFAGGVDALADDGDFVAIAGEVHDRLGARDRHAGLAVARAGRVVVDKRAQGRHVRRRGAAATAHDAHAVLDHAGDGLGVLGCLDIKDGIAVIVNVGQSRIGLHHNGLVGNGEHTCGESSELGRSLAAVDAQNVGADGVERDGGHLGTRSQEGATVFLKGHGGKDGQVGVLAAGEDRRLDLGQVGHSLDNKEVHARGDAGAHFLGKEVVGLVEAQGTQGAKQRADGADVTGDVAGAGLAGTGDGRGKDVCHGGGTVELVGVGAKGVGGDHVAAGLDVLTLNVGNDLGFLKVEQLGQGARLHASGLQHGAHAAVEQQVSRALDGRTQAIVLNAQIVDRARLVRDTVATCGINGCRQRGAVQIMSDKRSKHRWLLMAGIAGGVGGAEAAVLAHAADIAGGAALGVVDFAVEQTNHSGHALGGHEQAGGGDGKSNEARGIECIHDRALGRERAVAIAGTEAPVAGEPVCSGCSLDPLVHLLDGGLHIGRACGVEHGAFQGLLGSRGAQTAFGRHPEGAGHERRQAGVFEMSIDITTPQLNIGANQADAGLALLVDARGIDGKHASHAAGLDIQL